MNRYSTLVDALNALPVGAEAIADHLAASGVQAVCGEPNLCAIADYLTRSVAIPDGCAVYVSENAASVRRLDADRVVRSLETVWFDEAHRVTDAGLSRADIREFIENFDRGQYPDLVGVGHEPKVAA